MSIELLEEVLTRENLNKTYKNVIENKGVTSVDKLRFIC